MRLRQDGADTVLDFDFNGGGDSWIEKIRFQNTTATSFTANTAPGFDPVTPDSNDAPQIGGDLDITVQRNASVVITSDDLIENDQDDFGAALNWSASNVTNGFLALSSVPGVPILSFNNTDLEAGNVLFVHDGSASSSGGFDVVLTDDEGAGSGVSTVQATVNSAPTVTGLPSDFIVTENTASDIDLSTATFADINGDTLTVTLSASSGTFSAPADGSGVGGGVMETLVNATTITLAGSAADINSYLDTASNIQYTGTLNAIGENTANVAINVSDGFVNPQLAVISIDIAEAPSLVVTTQSDVVDEFDGETSLREAIAHVNSGALSGTITFASGSGEAFENGGTVTLSMGQLTATTGVTINGDVDGDGTPDITIDADGSGRVIQYTVGGISTLNGVTITGANTNVDGGGVTVDSGALTLTITDTVITGNSGGAGAGIWSGGTLTVINSTISNNTSTVTSGGGVRINSGSANFDGVTIDGNQSAGLAGGLMAAGGATVDIVDSVFSGNSGTFGGAIWNTGATLNVGNTLISANTATNNGGGLANDGTSTFVNTTFVGNSAGMLGGAISSGPHTLNLFNHTITGNTAGVAGGGYQFNGAGSNYNIVNGIISSNFANGNPSESDTNDGQVLLGGNIFGTNVYDGATIIGTTTLADIFTSVGNNPDTGVQSGLLASNGGPIDTVLIKAGGDAQNAGDDAQLPTDALDLDGNANTAEALPVDARGETRVNKGALDLGAVELVNTPPDARDDLFSVFDAGTISNENLFANNNLGVDSDPDMDAFTITEVNGSTTNVGEQFTLTSGALLDVASDGGFVYDPNGQFDELDDGESDTDSFTYTIDDGFGGTDTAIVLITIDGLNNAPTADADAGAVNEDGPAIVINVIANDDDVDVETLSIASFDTSGTTGSVIQTPASTTSFTYNPNGQFEALGQGQTTTDTFTYIATDGDANSNAALVTVTITGVNDGPDALDDAFTGSEDDLTITGNVLAGNGSGADSDIDNGDAITVTAINGSSVNLGETFVLASGAEVILNADGSFDYDPNGAFDDLSAGETGSDSFTYQITDNFGATDTATVGFTINGVNDAPVISFLAGDQLTLNEGDPAAVIDQAMAASLADVDSADFDGGAVTVAITSGGEASEDVLSVRNQGMSSGQIGVSGNTVLFGGVAIGLLAGGAGGVALAISLTANADDAAVSALLQNITYVNTNGDDPLGGVREIDITVDDGDGGSSSQTVMVGVDLAAVNDAPEIGLPTTPDTNEDTDLVFSASGGNPIQIADADAGNAVIDVTLSVSAGVLTVAPGSGASVTDGGTGAVSLSGTLAQVNAALDGLAFSPVADASGDVTLTVTANDNGAAGGGGAKSDTESVTIAINPVNDGPTARDDSAGTDEDSVVSGNLFIDNGAGADSDIDSASLNVGAVNGQAGNVGAPITLASGALLTVFSNGDFSYDPNGAFETLNDGDSAVETFTYLLEDGDGGADMASVTIAVDGVTDNLNLTGTPGNDVLVGGVGDDTIDGLASNDIANGLDGADSLIGGAGNDTLKGAGGGDVLEGGDGADSLEGGAGVDTLRGEAGNDTLIGDAGNDALYGGAENDSIMGGDGVDNIKGAGGADTLLGGNDGDAVNGGSGGDFIKGAGGDDIIIGLDGDDLLSGGAGEDTMVGGAGSDIFLFAPGDGQDVINDFQNGADVINLALLGSAFDSFNEILAASSDQSGDVVISFGGGDQLTLLNYIKSDLSAEDFGL
ncbi:MAG: Ig-like domain-containing protein [Pseudomonadota bacterium]